MRNFHYRYVVIVFIAILTSIFNIRSQRIIYVYDNNNAPVHSAVLNIIKKNVDGESKSSELSDSNGKIMLHNVPQPEDSISVLKYGFERFADLYLNVGDTIYLKENIVELDSLVVTADMEQLKSKAGKFIFTPGALKNDVSNSYELIKLAPLIEVKDANVSIFGVGSSRIQINGEDPHMSEEAIMDMLRGKKPDEVIRIEIITNPGSSHSASNHGGIVNIIMKDPTQGLIGSLRADLTYTYSRFKPSPSIWLGYARKKFNMTAYLSYRFLNYLNKSLNEYIYPNYKQKSDMSKSVKDHDIRLSLTGHYKFSNKFDAGIGVNLGTYTSKESFNSKTEMSADGSVPNITEMSTVQHHPWNRPAFSVVWYSKLVLDSKGSTLDLTMDYYNSSDGNNTTYDKANSDLNVNSESKKYGYHFKPLYNWNISGSQFANFGYDLAISDSEDINVTSKEFSDFKYHETFNSLFASLNSTWSSSFSTYIGLRMEHSAINSRMNGILLGDSQKKLDFFPSVSLSYTFPKYNQSISIDYYRSIYRPYLNDLNPRRIYIADNVYMQGNPELASSYSNNIYAYYSFLKDWNIFASWSISTNGFSQYTFKNGDDTVISFGNFGKMNSFIVGISFNRQLIPAWRMKVEANFCYTDRKVFLEDQDLSYKDFHASFTLNNNFIISRRYKISAMLSYYLASPVKLVTEKTEWRNDINFSISKVFSDNMSLMLEASNLLQYKRNVSYVTDSYSYYVRNLTSPMNIKLSFQWVFGKKAVSTDYVPTDSKIEQRLK